MAEAVEEAEVGPLVVDDTEVVEEVLVAELVVEAEVVEDVEDPAVAPIVSEVAAEALTLSVVEAEVALLMFSLMVVVSKV